MLQLPAVKTTAPWSLESNLCLPSLSLDPRVNITDTFNVHWCITELIFPDRESLINLNAVEYAIKVGDKKIYIYIITCTRRYITQ